MQLETLQEDLVRALAICSRFTSTRVQLPVLANILLEASKNKLNISATNLEMSVALSVGAKVEEEGKLTVPSRIITEIVSNLNKGQLFLKSEKENLIVKNSDVESKLSGMNASDFPDIPSGLGSGNILFSLNDFALVNSKVLFSVSSEETRPVLTGVLTILRDNEVSFVATDGFRLSQLKMKKNTSVDEEKRIIIPKSTLSEVVRVSSDENINFSYKKSDNMILFGYDNALLSSRIIEGEFPDFERIIPKESGIKLDVDKDDFLRNIKLASVFAKDSANVIKMEIGKGFINVLSESQQYGKQNSKLDAKIDGDVPEKFVIAFNFKFLEDFVNSVVGQNIKMEMSGPSDPVLFLDPKTNDYLHIIMPIRLQE